MHSRHRLRQRAGRVLAGVVVALGLVCADAAARAPSNTPAGDWMVVGGHVNAVARAGDTVFLGGWFTGLARRAPGVAAFDAQSGSLEAPSALLDRIGTTPVVVRAVIAAPDGGVYVAGEFAGAGGVAQPRLLRFDASGELDLAFRPQLPSGAQVVDMGVAGGVLYLAGEFGIVSGQVRSGLAVDAATGASKQWQVTTAGTVTQLEVGPNAVYLGGEFTRVGAEARARAAAVSLADAALLPWRPLADGGVRALAVNGPTVYLGGEFTTIGDAARSGLAAVDAVGVGDGSGALKAWNPRPSRSVTRIAVSGSRVFVAGEFTRIGAQPTQPSRAFLAAIDAATGEALGWDPLANRRPSDLAVHDGRLYLSWNGGPGATLPRLGANERCGLAAVSVDDSAAVTDWNPSVAAMDASKHPCDPQDTSRTGPDALAVAGGRVWAGGSFGVANVRRRSGLAALDARTGQPLPWAPELGAPPPLGSDIVHELLPSRDGSTIYIGGTFARVNGQTRRNAAAVATLGTGATSADLKPWNPRPDNTVRALALSLDDRLVYLGGDFNQAGGLDRRRLAAVGAGQGLSAEPWRPDPNGRVDDLLVDPASKQLFVAGAFSTIGDPAAAGPAARAGIAALDVASTMQAPRLLPWNLALLGGAASSATVHALALRGSEIVAGGSFEQPGGPANLGAFDVATAERSSWNPQVNRRVLTVTSDPADGTAYITGAFTTVGDEPRNGVAAVDASGAPTGWDPAPGPPITGAEIEEKLPGGVLLLDDDRLLLTGAFGTIGDLYQQAMVVFGPAGAPTAIAPPSIAGAAQIGSDLTCRPGLWGGGDGRRRYAWLRDGNVILGATAATYRTVAGDGRRALRCRETMINAAQSVAQVSSPITITGLAPVLDSPPAVAGQRWVGAVAQCTTGLWRNGPTAYTYRWLLGGAAIAGATTSTYAVGAADLGATLACEVTAANDDGVSPPALSAAVTITEPPPAALGEPLISGDARVGGSVACLPGPWARARSFSYQWLRDRVALADAVTPSYQLTSRDLGRTLTCLVTAANDGGSASAESAGVVVAAAPRSTGTGRRPNPADDAAAPAARRGVVIRTIRLRSTRTLAVTVTTPSAGRITVTVVRATGAPAKVIARATRSVRRATRATVQVRLLASARRLVARAGPRGLRVTVRVSFRPVSRATTASSDRATRTLSARAAGR